VSTDAADGTLHVGHHTTALTDGQGRPQNPDVLVTPGDVTTGTAGAGLVIQRAERVRPSVAVPAGERIAAGVLVGAWRLTQR